MKRYLPLVAATAFIFSGCLPDTKVPDTGGGTDSTYTIGGNVTGVSGSFGNLSLQLNGAETVLLTDDASYNFTTEFSETDAYDVRIIGLPMGYTCEFSTANNNAVMASADVVDINVACRITTQVAAGHQHSCALLVDRTVKCWGKNSAGQLGDGTTNNSSVPVVVAGLGGIKAISTGDSSCVILTDGTVKCWGYNAQGQLGNGTKSNSISPVTVSGLNNAVKIANQNYSFCVLQADQNVACWGYNAHGGLGDGTITDSNVPVVVTSASNKLAIDGGTYLACASIEDGSLECWGYNSIGQLGNSTTTDSNIPVTVQGL
ncbi:MAG: hypothetical protein HRU20_21560 [Pseudomonadales bacterium]|nr:hypothetical protein [Pseudomonadales bacterium]